jgi:hypothetical protein
MDELLPVLKAMATVATVAVVTRRKYQTVGVTAFMLGCKYEERHNPNLMDLSYITDYSSTKQDVSDPSLMLCPSRHLSSYPPITFPSKASSIA